MFISTTSGLASPARQAGCTQAHPYRKSTEARKCCEEIHQAHLRIQEIGNKLSFKRKEE
jgi:hypothetical protein